MDRCYHVSRYWNFAWMVFHWQVCYTYFKTRNQNFIHSRVKSSIEDMNVIIEIISTGISCQLTSRLGPRLITFPDTVSFQERITCSELVYSRIYFPWVDGEFNGACSLQLSILHLQSFHVDYLIFNFIAWSIQILNWCCDFFPS